MYDRAFPFQVFQVEPHWFKDRQEIGKQDRGVNAEHALCGECDFGSQCRCFTELNESHLVTNFHVFGQITTRLSHDPDGCRVDGFAADRFHESTVLIAGGLGHGGIHVSSFGYKYWVFCDVR